MLLQKRLQIPPCQYDSAWNSRKTGHVVARIGHSRRLLSQQFRRSLSERASNSLTMQLKRSPLNDRSHWHPIGGVLTQPIFPRPKASNDRAAIQPHRAFHRMDFSRIRSRSANHCGEHPDVFLFVFYFAGQHADQLAQLIAHAHRLLGVIGQS